MSSAIYSAQPPMQPMPMKSDRPRQVNFQPGVFQNGFCSCCDPMGTCCLGCWCPCIIYSYARSRMMNPQLRKGELPVCTGACCGYATVLLLCPGFQCIFGCMNRADIRNKYQIDGNCCTDCLLHWCCDCCVRFPYGTKAESRH
jgi:Cys-rich protein (TIGR01571 family)